MNEITCYDENGNVIDRFTQWDINRSIYIEWDYDSPPIFQFGNSNSEKLLLVPGELMDGTLNGKRMIRATVPNVLLQDALPLLCFVFLETIYQVNDEDAYMGKVVAMSRIHIFKKTRPDSYVFEDNVDYLSWDELQTKALKLMYDLETQYGDAKTNADAAAQSASDTAELHESVVSLEKTIRENHLVNISTYSSDTLTYRDETKLYRDEAESFKNTVVSKSDQIEQAIQTASGFESRIDGIESRLDGIDGEGGAIANINVDIQGLVGAVGEINESLSDKLTAPSYQYNTEFATGEYYKDKQVFAKLFRVDTLPNGVSENANNKYIDITISNKNLAYAWIDQSFSMAWDKNNIDKFYYTIPFVSVDLSNMLQVIFGLNGSERFIRISTNSDWSKYSADILVKYVYF